MSKIEVAEPKPKILIDHTLIDMSNEDYEKIIKTSVTRSEVEKNTNELLGSIVASKNGKNYYFLWCKNKIKEENKIYFESEDDAKNAGYSLSQSCK